MSPYDDGWLMDLEPCAVSCLYGKHGAMRAFEQVRIFCAMAAHEANRVYCRALGDLSQEPWDSAPDWQRESALKGVDGVFAGAGPEKSHEGWLEEKRTAGWTFGATKDPVAKTHPCFVPYAELPPEQREKDVIFVSSVRMMAMALGYGPSLPQGVDGGTRISDSLTTSTRPA